MRIVILLLFMAITVFSQNVPPIETGVSQSLAQWRAKHYSDVRYKLNLTLEKMSPVLKGSIEVSVRVSDGETARKNVASSQSPNVSPSIILDWRKNRGKEDTYSIKNVELNGKPTEFEEINEHLVFKNAKQGENIIKLDFTSPISTSGSAITRYIDKEDGSEYIYSLFVPSDASTAFPVFDQPDLKARFQLNLEIPNDWKAITNSKVSNLPLIKDSYASFANSNLNYRRKTFYTFEETQPISTYVFAFAAGNFEEVKVTEISHPELTPDGKNQKVGERFSTNIYVRKSQAEKFKPHAQEVFRLNRECVKYLEEYFDYKFPFPKYDLVLIPEFPFGGMEHAGATFLRESSIIFPSEPTKNDLISRANLIFHEAAHQWFGDTVTMKWFDDLWLKEGFAEFMAYKSLEKIMPEANAWKAFYERNKQLAYLTDSTKGTTPIYQEIPNLSSAKSAYGNIVYRKAPSFLRQAEFYLGEKEFQTAVRSFLKKNEFKNATWQDLLVEFQKVGKVGKTEINKWATEWLTQKGLPIVSLWITREFNLGVNSTAILKIDNTFNDKSRWKNKINVMWKFSNGTQVEKREIIYSEGKLQSSDINDSIRESQFPPLADEGNATRSNQNKNFQSPHTYIFPNYQDYGYGIFLLDERSRNYILANVQNEKDDFLRSMMYGTLWDSVREAELNPKNFVELAIKNVGNEKDEMIVSAILSRVNTAFAYYLDEKTRNELSPKLEEVLLGKMQTAETLGQKITFYRAFLNVVSSEKGKDLLKDFLKPKPQSQRPFEFKTKDKFDIIAKLLILGDKDTEKLLAELTKTETSDDAKRYTYAALAGIPTAENKSKYWQDFVANKEISESWIEASFGNFNSPKHSDLTVGYLEKALSELPNLKKNRKIFFVNGWLGAFIGGQKSEQALQIVNKFLADNPNLDKDLKLKILENADIIERAVKIRQKFANAK